MGTIVYLSSAAARHFRLSKPHLHSYLRYITYSDLVSPDEERNVKLDSGSIKTEQIDVNPKSVHVHKAYELFKGGHKFLDVRTRDEFVAGHPSGATNIAYMFRAGEGAKVEFVFSVRSSLAEMLKNPEFLSEASSKFEKHEKLLLGCKSGRRSLLAAKELQSFGFTSVVDVAGGYTAWKESGLPINN